MILASVSREFGFGRLLTEDELAQVNIVRQIAAHDGGPYRDTAAAMKILGTTRKPILKESPFVKSQFIGVNNEGYWNSYHMSLQFEDVVDCVRVLYPTFDFVFLFDHSQGHARKRDGALSAVTMSKNFGGVGAQQQMRDPVIVSQEAYLDPHSPTLSVGESQSLVFKSGNTGPWYLSPEQKELQRCDRTTGRRKVVEKTKKTLVEELNDRDVICKSWHKRSELRAINKLTKSNWVRKESLRGCYKFCMKEVC